MAQILRQEEMRTRTERPVTSREPATLEYATKAPSRRGRFLRASVGVSLIVCGTFLAVTPWWAAGLAIGANVSMSIVNTYFSGDFKWITVVLGAIMILAGTF